MNLQNISAWSIRNPVVPLVLFAALLLAGMMSFKKMDVNDNPDIDFPAAEISISLPGAAPSEIETQITQITDAALRSINGVANISSTAREGSSRTFVEFSIGTDTDQAVNDVRSAIDTVRGDLPDGILEPRINRVDIGSGALAYFAVGASDMSLEQLSWFVDDTVSKRLQGVDGMAAVFRGGGVDREIRVVVDPAKMQALGVTASQINRALRQVNTDAGGGQAEIAGSRQSVRVLGNADTALQLSETQVSLGGGRTIKLKDVAKVSDSFGEQRSLNKVGDKQVVTFGFQRAKGASDVTVYDAAVLVLDEIKKENPGIEFKRTFSIIDYTKAQYRSSIAAMVEGALLAIVVVFLFLRDWRATIISAVAIPLSAIPAFWFMDLMGFSLNQMSLLALAMVAGVLVDDAIVEVENIVRHMRMGKSAYQASIDAADEIGLAVVATTFSIVAVFLPVGLMPGVTGQFFQNFGLTVVVAVLMSLAVARMISPMIAAYFMKAHGEAEHAGGPWMERYVNMLKWSLHNRWKMVMVGIAAFLATIGMFFVVPSQFFPDADTDFAIVNVGMVPGTTLDQTERVTKQVADILDEQQEVGVALQSIREGNSRIFVGLRDDRERTLQDFQREIAEEFTTIADARVSFQDFGPGGGGSGRAVSIMLSGSDPVLLEQTATTLVEQMKQVKGVVAPRINADMRRPEIIIEPRLDLAAQLGVTTVALSQAIRIATLGEIDQNSAKFSLSDRQIPIRVMLPESSRTNLSTIENLPVPTASGGSVPLSRVASIRFGSGPSAIQRYNQSRRIIVGADLAPGVVKGDADKLLNENTILANLPPGVSNAPVGTDEIQKELFDNFPTALVSGILLVFAVLVLLYKRFMAPLVNMASLLIAPLGGMLLLWITGTALSLPVFIGVLMLIGIVGKNSILLIDFALLEMERGIPKYEALIDAGRKRAQPIVMTTVAMVAGMVPTALSLSGDSAWRQPMGVVVIGGLILSTIMTLALVPAGFSLADDIEKWFGRNVGSRILSDYKLTDDDTPQATPEPDRDAARVIDGNTGIQPAE